jgi:epoxyqueuosine reductase QueG
MDTKNKNYSTLKKYCQGLGIDLFGVGDIASIKDDIKVSKDVLNKLDKAVCLGVRLSGSILEEITYAPTKLYFHHYRTINALLDQSTLKTCNFIQNKGFKALPIPASIILDWENQTAHLSHKKLGVLAGLGWIGRNNLLVNKTVGSQFRLSTILTDMPLKIDKPSKDACGSCQLCVKLCPAQAIKMDSLDFDHVKCFEKLKEFQKQKLVDQYVCGVCVNVCRGKAK